MLWATRCPDCRAAVYFFSCNCGSKVFFNLAQPPWDPHRDGCIPYLARDLRDNGGYGPGDVLRMVEHHANSHGLAIDPKLHKELRIADGKTRRLLTVIEVAPANLTCDIICEVIQVDERINFFKMVGYPENQASRTFLGTLASEDHAAVSLHVNEAPAGFISKFRVFVPVAAVRRAGVHKGSKAFLTIRGHSLPTDELIWLAASIEDVRKAGMS